MKYISFSGSVSSNYVKKKDSDADIKIPSRVFFHGYSQRRGVYTAGYKFRGLSPLS